MNIKCFRGGHKLFKKYKYAMVRFMHVDSPDRTKTGDKEFRLPTGVPATDLFVTQ